MPEKGTFRKHMSAMTNAKKGSLVDKVGTDAGPDLPVVPDNSQFQGSDFSGVASNPKGASLAQKGQRGGGPALAGGEPLTAHMQGDPTGVSAGSGPGPVLAGNHGAKRGPGTKTKTDLETARKLSEAGP